MKRLFPALALLILLASASEANACGGWCLRFFAQVFGVQNVQNFHEAAPLIVQPPVPQYGGAPALQIAVQQPPAQLAIAINNLPAAPAPEPPLLLANLAPVVNTVQRWGIGADEARRLFDKAYERMDAAISRDDSYRRWLSEIVEPTDFGFGFDYTQWWGDNYIRLTRSSETSVGTLQIDVAHGNDMRAEGPALGFRSDNPLGILARSIVAHGGQAQFSQIRYLFQIREFRNQRFYQQAIGGLSKPALENVLNAAGNSQVGILLSNLIGFSPTAYDVVKSNTGAQNFRVTFSPPQARGGAQNEDQKEEEKGDF